MNQLKVGALLSYVNMALHILIGLIYVPLLLHFLSVEEYGLYQLIGSLVAYLSVMDFGLSGTITRFYSQRLALDDTDGQENVLAISLIIYLVIAGLVFIAGIALYNLVETVYGASLTVGEIDSAKSMVVLLVINVALTIPSNVFTSAITSHERFVFLRLVTIIQSILKPFVVVAVLMYKAEALSIVQVQFVFNVLVIIINVWYAFSKVKIKIRLHAFDGMLVKSMLNFSFFVFLAAIVDQVYWKTGQLILGVVSGTTSVAIFSIAIILGSYYIQFSAAIHGVFLPLISRLATLNEDMGELNQLFIKAGRIQFSLLGLILTGFVLFGRQFLLLWTGKQFLGAYSMTLVIMIPLTLPLTQNLGTLILQAKNKHAFRSIVYVVIALINVAVSIPLAKLYGGLGCAIATGGSLFLGNGLIINIYYKTKIGIDVSGFFKNIGKLSIPVLISGLIGYFYTSFFAVTGWLSFAVSVMVYSFVYFTLIWIMGFNAYEKQLVTSITRRLYKKKK